MKKERRVAIKAISPSLEGICIFRSMFLERLLLSKSDVESKFYADPVKEEVVESNFGYRSLYKGELEGICLRIVSRISEKLNTIKR